MSMIRYAKYIPDYLDLRVILLPILLVLVVLLDIFCSTLFALLLACLHSYCSNQE